MNRSNGLKRLVAAAAVVGSTVVSVVGCTRDSSARSSTAVADKYPIKPVEVIVPWGPGGGADQLARVSAPLVEKSLGASLPVINVPGATGTAGLTKLLSAAADGHSMAVYTGDSTAVLATAETPPPWKLEDLTTVARMIKTPSCLFVKTDGKYRSWADFEKEARANPGKLKVAHTGQGSPGDLTVLYLASKGIKLQGVPYPNPSERFVSVIGGHTDAVYSQVGNVRQYLEGKQLLPIIVFNQTRLDAYPDVPSSHELGLDIFLPQTRSIVVRAGTDPRIVKVLAEAFKKAYDSPEYQKWLQQQDGSKDSYLGPEDAGKFLKEDFESMRAVMPKK